MLELMQRVYILCKQPYLHVSHRYICNTKLISALVKHPWGQ